MTGPVVKRLFVVGSTGSIGTNTLDVAGHLNRMPQPPFYEVVGLSARKNLTKLREQIRKWRPMHVAVCRPDHVKEIENEFPETNVFCDLNDAVKESEFDVLVNAVVGSAGLLPTMTAVGRGADIALANKETLVVAGKLVMDEVRKNKTQLLPIDSEHSALFSLLEGRPPNWLRKLVLTASGGPFFRKATKNPTIKDVLDHPTWRMGKKISVDSATMMNKGFEVMEAHHLFGVPYESIEAVIHPQSIVHAFVEATDGSWHSHLGHADMRLPIQKALAHPEVLPSNTKPFSITEVKKPLEFFAIDENQFPLMKLALECGRKGGSFPVALNAANEIAVHLFLQGKTSFESLFSIIHRTIEEHRAVAVGSVEDVLQLDKEVRNRLLHDHGMTETFEGV